MEPSMHNTSTQYAEMITPVRIPGYRGYFPGVKGRPPGVPHADPPRLQSPRRSNNVLKTQTSIYHPLERIPRYHTRPDPFTNYVMERRNFIARRSQGIPRYNIFNCVDRDEVKPVTAADDEDRFDLLVRRANVYNKLPRPKGYFHRPITTNHMFTESNITQCTSNVLPFPLDYHISPHLYKVWEDVRPIFDRTTGNVRHDLWGMQDRRLQLLPDKNRIQQDLHWYPRQDEYQRLVADKALTACRVASVSGIDYANPTQPYIRRVHVPAETNPVQKQQRYLYTNSNLYI